MIFAVCFIQKVCVEVVKDSLAGTERLNSSDLSL